MLHQDSTAHTERKYSALKCIPFAANQFGYKEQSNSYAARNVCFISKHVLGNWEQLLKLTKGNYSPNQSFVLDPCVSDFKALPSFSFIFLLLYPLTVFPHCLFPIGLSMFPSVLPNDGSHHKGPSFKHNLIPLTDPLITNMKMYF